MKPAKNPFARLLEAAQVSSDDFFKGRLEEKGHELTVQVSSSFNECFYPHPFAANVIKVMP